jgi:putative ABC transport system ATP-binding protein
MNTSAKLRPPLQVERLTKRFRQGNTTIEALKNISLSVERGEFVAVMGASGSGKSTLLHVMAGLTRPDEGRVLLPALADGRGRLADQQLDGLLARLGLAERRHHRPDAMSGGEQQRVAIARAMIGDPSIILADEPTGSLDSVTGQGICRLLRELREEQGRTIVVVTHEPTVAVWAERIVVLKDGQTLTEFPTAEFHDAHCRAAHYQDIVGAAAAAEVRG